LALIAQNIRSVHLHLHSSLLDTMNKTVIVNENFTEHGECGIERFKIQDGMF